MSLEVTCPSCEGKFRVPDSAAGKKIRCPKCKGAIEVPAAETEAEIPPEPEPEPEPEPAPPPPEKKVEKKAEKKAETPTAKKVAAPVEQWFLKGEDGESYGPVPKKELDAWKKEGRVTADCQLLKEGTTQWQWAPDVYPDLEAAAEEEPAPEPEPEVPAKKSAPQVAAKKSAARWQSAEEDEAEEEEKEEPEPVAKVAKTSAKRSKKSAAKTDDEDEDKSSRSKAIAGLLGIFLGPVGAHRFYLGYWGLGIAMLLTGGGCGIWSLVDGIFILLGKIPDADGRMLSD